MAFGTNKGERRPVVFLNLRTNAKVPGGVGFQQELSKAPNPAYGSDPKAPKWLRETAMHQFVEGRITGFKVSEEESYEDKSVKYKVGHVRIADTVQPGQAAGPDVIVNFRMDNGHGRKLVGLIANALVNNNTSIHLKTNQADAGETIGDQTLTAPRAFVTANLGDAHGPRIDPPYYIDSSTGVVREEAGKASALPRGVEVVVNKKVVLDWTNADSWTEETAAVLQSLFEVPAPTDAEASGEDHGEEEIDLHAAAAAAAPQGN